MWSPTHVQVTVHRARNLRIKGRNLTNDAFVVIQMGKEKFQTTVKEKSVNPEWNEECDFNYKSSQPVLLIAYHRNLFGMDEFLGEVSISLDPNKFDRHVSKWFNLVAKSNKRDGKYRGEIEATISFVVRSNDIQSLNEFAVSKKKRASIAGIASSVGHKILKLPGKAMTLRSETFDPQGKLARLRGKSNSLSSDQGNDTDSTHTFEDSDSLYDEFDATHDVKAAPPVKSMRKFSSLYSSTLSLPPSAMITSSIQEDKSLEEKINKSNNGADDEVWDSPDKISILDFQSSFHADANNKISSHMKDLTRSEINLFDISSCSLANNREKKNAFVSIKNTLRRHTMQLAEAPDFTSLKILSPNKHQPSTKKFSSHSSKEVSFSANDVPPEILKQYEKISQQDLIILAIQQQTEVEKLKDKISDMEAYLDNLLVRVMETTPKILQTPYESLNPAISR